MKRAYALGAAALIGLIALVWLLAIRPSVAFSDKYDDQPCYAVLEPLGSWHDFNGPMPDTSHRPDPGFTSDELDSLNAGCDRERTSRVAAAALIAPLTVLVGYLAFSSRRSSSSRSSRGFRGEAG